MRVIIPLSLRNRVLQELHEEHPGIVAMKAITQSYIWWLNLNAEIELTVRTCEVCQAVRNAPPSAPLYPWRWPTRVSIKECLLILQRKMATTSLG